MSKRDILVEKKIDVEKFRAKTQLISIYERSNLLNSVTKIRPYPPMLIKEFYGNLIAEVKNIYSPLYDRIWNRHKWNNFIASKINMYLVFKRI